jgi:hypothetical protein
MNNNYIIFRAELQKSFAGVFLPPLEILNRRI